MLDEVATDTMITQTSDSLYTQLIKTAGEHLSSGNPGSLGEIRKQALERFEATGFPTVKNEDWKYTNVQPLVNRAYALEAEALSGGAAWEKARIPDLDVHRIVLVNGQYNSELSSNDEISGLQIMPIEQAFERLCFAKYFNADRKSVE